MSSTALDYLRGLYNPDLRAMKIVAMGSTFVLAVFLTSPDFTNRYHLLGITATVFALLVSIAILAYERRDDW